MKRHLADRGLIQEVVADRVNQGRPSDLGIKNFETWADCERQQRKMLSRFQRAGYDAAQLAYLSECRAPGNCEACTEGCHFAVRRRRAEGIRSAYQLLVDHGGPYYDVSIVHPKWERAVGQLATSNISAAIQWQYRRLRGVPGVVAVGSYEVSLNRELDGEVFWAGELHEVAAGAPKEVLKHAFQIETSYRETRPHNKLVMVTPVENLGARLAYSLKRFVEERRAYISTTNGRQHRRHLPPRLEHWLEHDKWLLSLPIGARTVAFGCHRVGNRFTARGAADQCPLDPNDYLET